MSTPAISILGTGKVAYNMAAVLSEKTNILQVIGRNESKLEKFQIDFGIESAKLDDPLRPTDILIICISDDAISEVVQRIAPRLSKECIVCHTSGTQPLDAILEFWPHAGIFYPLQTFTEDRTVDFKKIPLLITSASSFIEKTLINLASIISDNVLTISDDHRKDKNIH